MSTAEVDRFRKTASFDLGGSKSPHAIALVPRLEWIICMASSKGTTRNVAAEPSPTRYRVQYLDSFSTTLAERHAYSSTLAGALALVEGVAFPAGAVRMRILDAAGHLVHPKE